MGRRNLTRSHSRDGGGGCGWRRLWQAVSLEMSKKSKRMMEERGRGGIEMSEKV